MWQRYDVVDRARTTYPIPVTHVIAHQRRARSGGGLVTVVVGCTPKESGTAALELAAMLARSTGEDVVVAVVVAAAWPPSTERVDADYRAYLTQRGEQTLAQAEEWMPDDVKTTFVAAPRRLDPDRPAGGRPRSTTRASWCWGRPRAAASATSRWAASRTASCTAHRSRSPSRRAASRPSRVAGSAGSRWRSGAPPRTGRWSSPRPTTPSARRARCGSRRSRCGPRCCSPRPWPAPGRTWWSTSGPGRRSEVIDEELDRGAQAPDVPRQLEVVIGDGYGWREAMGRARWSLGDLLVVGSSSHGPVASVFLGSRSSKILRYAPVPVMVLPRTHT